MKYAVVLVYTPDTEKTQAVRPAHRAYLAGLREHGQLVVAGPFTDGDTPGALIIYEAPSVEGVESLIRSDPFCQEGIFRSWTVREWNQVF